MERLERQAWALRDLGFEIEVAFGGTGFFWRRDGRFGSWTPHAATENTEAAVRAAVLRVAPGSRAEPMSFVAYEGGVGWRGVRVEVRGDRGGSLRHWGNAEGASYAEAWINAAEAIVAAGLHRHPSGGEG